MCKMSNHNLNNYWFKSPNQFSASSSYDQNSYQCLNSRRVDQTNESSFNNPDYLLESNSSSTTTNENNNYLNTIIRSLSNQGIDGVNDARNYSRINYSNQINHVPIASSLNHFKSNSESNHNFQRPQPSLAEMKIMLARASQKLAMIIQKKKDLETEEQRLKTYIDQNKLRIERLELATRDPRLKNKLEIAPNSTNTHSINTSFSVVSQPGNNLKFFKNFF